MSTSQEKVCCPEFKPEKWDEKEIVWEGKNFVTDTVRDFMYMPLNFASKMKKNTDVMEEEKALPSLEEFIVLSDMASPWKENIYLSATKEVDGLKNTTISGTFLTKVYEGGYKEMKNWIKEQAEFVKSRGKEQKKMYAYYTTCPKCSRKYGKNYVVFLSQVS